MKIDMKKHLNLLAKIEKDSACKMVIIRTLSKYSDEFSVSISKRSRYRLSASWFLIASSSSVWRYGLHSPYLWSLVSSQCMRSSKTRIKDSEV